MRRRLPRAASPARCPFPAAPLSHRARDRPRGRTLLHAVVLSAALSGLDPVPVQIEVSMTNGLPAFHIVGLPDAAVRESRERVVSALRESGFDFPLRRITANLAPAHLRKEGSAFDLPLALAVLAASGQVPAARLDSWLVVGELALDGTLRPVRGALAYAECTAARGAKALIVPASSAAEASLARVVPVWPATSLKEVAGWLRGASPPDPTVPSYGGGPIALPETPLDDIAGQALGKRALEIAAAGGHNLLFIGPPGVGKTMLARALRSLLPPLSPGESLEVTRIHSVAGLLGERAGLLDGRPFRAPHSTISTAGLLGGGSVPRPGEITLAHRGVLFLDELPEFRRDALEALRAPLEEGALRLVRTSGTVEFPAAFQLVTALNPCPCGNLGHPRKGCRCTPGQIRRYRGRVSGPLLDRIDLHVEMGPVPASELVDAARPRESRTHGGSGPQTTSALERIRRARSAQEERAALDSSLPGRNRDLSPAALARVAPLTPAARAGLEASMARLSLSARGLHRAWRVARTIADLDGAAMPGDTQFMEALSYRSLDRRR